MLLAVAVILGIVLLQQFDAGIDTGQVRTGTDVGDAPTTTRRVTLTTVGGTTTTVARARPKADVKVVVANGAGVRGLGASTTNALKNVGYATGIPVDATAAADKTSIQFTDGYEAEAREVAQTLSQPATVVSRLSSPPITAADIGDAKVIVILGADVAASTTTAPNAPTGPAGTTSTTRRP